MRLVLALLLASAQGDPQRAPAAGDPRYELAQALEKRGIGFGAFYFYEQILEAGPSHPYFEKAAAGVAAVSEAAGDEAIGPSVLKKLDLSLLSPETRARVAYPVALLDYRAGNHPEAEKLLREIPTPSPRALYLLGLLREREDPAAALETFREVRGEAQELAWLALGRTLFGLHRYAEASAEYARLPRFSRHWDEALFEGAYADLLNGDPGGALGKLHALHSPHLSDEFVPESLNLTAIVYQERCLYPQARAALARFDADYGPLKRQLDQALARKDDPAGLLQPGRLPKAVRQHLLENERVAAMAGYLEELDRESARAKAAADLQPLDLPDLIARQKELAAQVLGKFVEGRLRDMSRLIDVLEADKEIVAFEVAKGEKRMIETNADSGARLAAQSLARPPMPAAGYEYWPFDGEYWPDEIGYYRYTLKNACEER